MKNKDVIKVIEYLERIYFLLLNMSCQLSSQGLQLNNRSDTLRYILIKLLEFLE